MEDRPKDIRFVKAIRNRTFSSNSSGEKEKGNREHFKQALDDLNRFEEELKRNLD